MFRKIVKIVTFPLTLLGLLVIYFYKFCISPLLPKTCRFYPSCSSYAVMALKEFGFFRGCVIAVKRIARCNPKSKCGYDPIPYNIKGDLKWLI